MQLTFQPKKPNSCKGIHIRKRTRSQSQLDETTPKQHPPAHPHHLQENTILREKDPNRTLPSSNSRRNLFKSKEEIIIGELIIIQEEDPTEGSPYHQDIYNHLKSTETKCRPTYPLNRPSQELKDRVRKIMIDWIIKVHYTLSLSPETLFLSVSLLDQYTSHFPTPRDAYQLTALAVLLLSCKVEEVQPPLVEDLLQITNHVFSRQQIKAAEYEILAALRFDLVRPSSFEFLLFYLNVSPVPEIAEYSSCFVLESTLMESSMYLFTPSLLAGASLFIARVVHRLVPWTAELSAFYAVDCEDFQNCVESILRHLASLRRSLSMKGLTRKYSIPAYMHVSALDYDIRGLLDFI